MIIEVIDTETLLIDIHRDLSVTTRRRIPGPPQRMDGMTIGVVGMSAHDSSPHNGEMHPDGDEILYLITGRVQISYDSGDQPLELNSGQACIVPKGEWHRIDCLEDAQLVHITPGPQGEVRFA